MVAVNKKVQKMHVLERVKYVKEILKPATEGLSDRDIRGIVLQITHYYNCRRKTLGPVHRIVNDTLLKHSLTAKTVYSWFLLDLAPPHIKDKLKAGKVSLKDASVMSAAWKKNVSTKSGKDIMAQMRAVIGGLQWRGQEELKRKF